MGWVWVEEDDGQRRGLCEDYPCCGHENASCGDTPGDLAPFYLRIMSRDDYDPYYDSANY